MGRRPKFTPELRARFLALIETGRTNEAALDDIGVTRETLNRHLRRGRAGDPDVQEFAEKYDELMAAGDAAAALSQDDLVRLMERSARKGSFQAQRYLLERIERGRGEGDLGDDDGQTDVFTSPPSEADDVFGDIDELAQRRRAG